MQKSLKKISRKSLSLLIALIMVISAMPFSPLSSPIEANAAEVIKNIDVWNATNARNGTLSIDADPRFSAEDTVTEYSLSGVRWGGSTINTNLSDNTKYLTIGNASLSCATLSSGNVSEQPTSSGFAEKNIKGKKWSFSAKFAYTGPHTSGTYTATTVFGIGTSDTYAYNNKSSNESNAMVANLVDIRENGNVYIALSNETSTTINPTLILSEENRNKLATDSASNPKVLTVTYDSGYLSIDINDDVIVAPREVDSALFEKGVSNFFMGANVQVYRGGNPAPHYKVSNNDAYIYNMNLYSLSGATYQTTGGGEEPTEPDPVISTGEVTSTVFGLLMGNGSTSEHRVKTDGSYVLCNDGNSYNFSMGHWDFNISGVTGNVNRATISGSFSNNGGCAGCKGVSFYAISPTYSLTSGGHTESTFTSSGYDAVRRVLKTYPDRYYMGSINYTTNTSVSDFPSTGTSVSGTFSFDFAPALQAARDRGWATLRVIAVPNYNITHTIDSNMWSDLSITSNTVKISYETTTSTNRITAAKNKNSVIGRIKLGDAIYTYASETEKYNFGKVISTTTPWYTPVTNSSGVGIKSVECIDDNSTLSVVDNKLTGTFNSSKFLVNDNKNVNATLKFTFNDNKVEFHRVAVKSFPIESHTCNQYLTGSTEAGFTTFARGSTGSEGIGVFPYYDNFIGSFIANGTNAYGQKAIEKENIATKDKNTGNFAFSNSSSNAANNASVANYYIDKSCRNSAWSNLGNSELWDGTNYRIEFGIVRTRFNNAFGSNTNANSFSNTTGATVLNSNGTNATTNPPSITFTKNDTNGYENKFYLKHNASISKATDSNYADAKNFSMNLQMTNTASATPTFNLVVNLFDKSTARNLYKTHIDKALSGADYTPESFAAYQEALLELETYLSNYEDTTEVGLTDAVCQNLVDAYNALRNYYVVKFATLGDYVGGVVTKTLNVPMGTTIDSAQMPSLKNTVKNSDGQHTRYYWRDKDTKIEFINTTKINTDLYLVEGSVVENCTFDNNVTADVMQSGDSNGYKKHLCDAGCGQENVSLREYESTDWSAYDAQKRVLDDLLADRTKFSPASLAECQTAYNDAVDGVTSDDVTRSQTFINNRTADLIAAKDLLKSTITFEVYDDSVGGSPSLLTTESFDVKYLDSKQLDVPNDYSTEYAVTSWKRNINGVDSQIATNTSSILAVVSTNITYMVYLKKTTIDENQASSKAVITLNNKSNKVVDVAYVEKNSGVEVTVDVNNGSITVGGQTLKAPTYSFYRVTGFKINGKTVNTGTIDITGDFIIKPEYEARTSFIITGGNGVVEKSTTTSWDKRVRLTAETPAQSGKINEWTSTINNKTVVWGYGDTLSFQATQACTVECAEVDATEFDGAEDVKLSVDYVSYNLYRANSITAISRVVAPEGTVLEYGTILKTANIKAGATNANYETQKAAVNNKDNYKVENKSGVFKATQKISNTDQFAYNFYSAQDYDKMYVGAVAYAKLSNGTTVYSDVVTYEVR